MITFSSHDGTRLACHDRGEGTPLVCLPGGPMQDSAYLAGLDDLFPHRRLIRLDLRGTGASAVPADPASYRCDRLVDDVEALRGHLGLETVDLLAHSAGANLAALYAARHPARVGRLLLVTPSVFAVGVPVAGDDRLEAARLRAAEPWFAPAYAALEELVAGRGTAATMGAVAPFWYGRWDEAARAHRAAEAGQKNQEAAAAYGAGGAFDPDATRAALAALAAPVLLLAGEADVAAPPRAMAAYAALFPDAALTVQPGAGHFPWLDDPEAFTGAVAGFLGA
ncbi:alpha/beta fold hydrolase [Streptomyces lavendulae]|uniref:alpha/beta fold hydrolase n=1 Tax=Streptomyces lavendulae TaxID=1914 RepID=UPI0024A1942E|nr:alpha/beta hydrolase [Streptomyces lavendulae]GLX16921.1 hydrolase [Streptomyces lavendulae subsp. lavendulae]GLX29428.1 hydrolase [Streptomyces lavendulae subsp. lavendulae]